MSRLLDTIRLPFPRWSCHIYTYTFILLAQISIFAAGVRAGDSSDAETKLGYKYGQSVPVSCLSRSIDSGEHVTDQTGALHYAPFPTCNETSLPLSFRYGVSETVVCTIDPVSDTVYHLLEYYVHSDVPLTCRVPTLPLEREEEGEGVFGSGTGVEGRAFTPLTVALQGTLQLSHLHVWSEMNVLMHRAGVVKKMDREEKEKKEKKDKKKKKWKDLKKQRGLVYAGTAYSLPSSSTDRPAEEDTGTGDGNVEMGEVENLSLDPWALGQGAKVVRGEPLTFTFRVSWVHGEDVPEQTGYSSKYKSGESGSALSNLFFLFVAAGFGAVLVLAWEKWVKNRRTSGYKGDGILGYSGPGKIVIGNSAFGAAKVNGYGGYGGGGTNGYSNGYGGYSSGKRD